jgi:hypothetical protein
MSFAIGAGLVLVTLVVAGAVLRPVKDADQAALREGDRPHSDAVLPAARGR